MASGLPDYYRGFRPRYGAAKLLRATKTVTKNDITLVGSIEGKGMIYGGDIYLNYTSDQGQSEVALHVDGSDIGSSRFDRNIEHGHILEHSYGLYQIIKDDVNYIYTVGILPGITFEEACEIYYTERHGGTPSVWARLIYALI